MESLASWFRQNLLPYGHWGILALAGLDSSFVPMPQFIDLAVMLSCAAAPARAPLFAAAAIVGSTAGTAVIFAIARGGRLASRLGNQRLAWAEDWVRRRGSLALLVAALLPPPFPFKAVVVAAGYLRQPAGGMVLGVGLGRLLRFGTEAYLAAAYGEPMLELVRDHGPAVGIALAAALVVGALLVRRWQAAQG